MDKRQFEKKRRRAIKKLLDTSTPEEKRRIKAGRKAGRILRKRVERL